MKKKYRYINAWKTGFIPAIASFLILASLSFINPGPSIAEDPQGAKEETSTDPLFQDEFKDLVNIPNCNRDVTWDKELNNYSAEAAANIQALYSGYISNIGDKKDDLLSESKKIIRNLVIRTVLISGNNNNLGAFPLKDHYWTDENGKKRPLTVFRSAITPWPLKSDSCFRSLLKNGKVKYVINLYDGKIPIQDHIDMEKEVAKELGAGYFDTADPQLGGTSFRGLVKRKEDYQDPERKKKSVEELATLLNKTIFSYMKKPEGNIYLHCGGGMHRSGMVSGIIQKCVNKMDIKTIQEGYARHVGFQSDDDQGGFEELNLQYIKEFDCGLLDLR